jgi:hypothetical protein
MDHTSNDPVTNALMGCKPDNFILIAYKRGCEDTREKLQKRIERLESALKPFADMAFESDGEMCERIADGLEDGAFIKAHAALVEGEER